MILTMYAIYDTAARVYKQPFFMRADGEALRGFEHLAVSNENDIGKHPEDYSLFRIGRFDDNKGAVEPQAPECIATALELVAKARQIMPGQLDGFDAEREDAQVSNGS